MSDRLQFTLGDVTDVQLTSETFIVEGEDRASRKQSRRERGPTPAGRITSRMRVFVKSDDGKERNFDFEGAKVGVRDGHRCAVVRGQCKGIKEPVNLVLHNISTDERDIFERGVAAYLFKKRFFGPLWKSFGLSLLVVPVGVFISQIVLGHSKTMSVLESTWWSVFVAFLLYPMFWWIVSFMDTITDKSRFKRERAALLKNIETRVRQMAQPKAAA